MVVCETLNRFKYFIVNSSFFSSMCGKMFSSTTLVREHERIHMDKNGEYRNGNEYECPKCSKRFERGGKILGAHINTCKGILTEKRRQYRFPCFECGKIFYTKLNCAEHLSLAHNINIPNVEKYCFKCKIEVDNPREHAMSHNDNFKCHLCGLAIFKNQIQAHLERHQSDESRPFSCDLCSLTFKTSNHLRSHKMSIHTTAEERRFVCSICQKRFAFKHRLNMHIKISHSSIKRYSCPFCSIKFKKLDIMKHHCKVEHGEESTYLCTDCPEKLKSFNDLRKHRKEQH